MITTLVYQQFMVLVDGIFGAALTMALLVVTLLLLTLIRTGFAR